MHLRRARARRRRVSEVHLLFQQYIRDATQLVRHCDEASISISLTTVRTAVIDFFEPWMLHGAVRRLDPRPFERPPTELADVSSLRRLAWIFIATVVSG